MSGETNAARVALKLSEFVSCVAAVIIKKLSDSHADRVYKLNKKLSREWRLFNNITWSEEGNDFSIFLFVGFAFITGIFLISSCTDHVMRLPEKLMWTFGTFFYVLEGCLVFASLEYIPPEIDLYAYLLGSVSLLIAALFVVDLCVYGSSALTANKSSQTDNYAVKEYGGGGQASSYRMTFRKTTENSFVRRQQHDADPMAYDFKKFDPKSPLQKFNGNLKKYLITAV